jgi:hypothetical protein
MPKYILPVGPPTGMMQHRPGRRFSHAAMVTRSTDFLLHGNDGEAASGRSTPSSLLGGGGGGGGGEDLNSSEEDCQLARRRIRCIPRNVDASDESGPSSMHSTMSSRLGL